MKIISCKFVTYVFFCIYFGNIYADNNLLATKNKLLDLNAKIALLQQRLQTANNKTSILTAELADTENKINLDTKQLLQIENTIKITQNNINKLEERIKISSQSLHTQQKLLAQHIRARYVISNFTPLKWLLNQHDATQNKLLLIFYRYFIFSHQQMIDNITITKKDLLINTEYLQNALLKNQSLQKQLIQHKRKLQADKIYNDAILSSLNKDITEKQQTLQNYQHNKETLSKLIASLNQQSMQQKQYSFVNTKYPKPAPNSTNSKKISNGLLFLAHEGTPVLAINSGKVVFSNWLNGYGLLLILDHGNGLMSLYAYNQSLWKRTGELVSKGEQIATIGHTGGIKQSGLYFEIRQRGKAVSPLQWLA